MYQYGAYSQTIANGLYVNRTGTYEVTPHLICADTVCVLNDSIAIKLFNNDAFGIYSAYYGKGVLKRNRLKLQENRFLTMTSSLSQEANNENMIKIRLLWADSTEIKYALVQIKKSIKDEGIVYQSGIDGVVVLDDKIYNQYNVTIINVGKLGYETTQEIKLEKGVTYTIISNIINDTAIHSINSSTKIKYCEKTKEIVIRGYGRKKRIIYLNRIGECDSGKKMVLR